MHTVWTSIVDTIRREVIRDLNGLAGRYTLPPLISYSTWSVLLPQKTESAFSQDFETIASPFDTGTCPYRLIAPAMRSSFSFAVYLLLFTPLRQEIFCRTRVASVSRWISTSTAINHEQPKTGNRWKRS